MAGVAKQIIGSFEEIGKEVARETVKAPTEIAGKAMESLGAKSGKQGQHPVNSGSPTDSRNVESGQTEKIHPAQARAWLEKTLGRKTGEKKLSVWEEIQREEAQKKEQAQKQAAQASLTELPKMTSKPKRGNLYGIKQKRAAAEQKATRQD